MSGKRKKDGPLFKRFFQKRRLRGEARHKALATMTACLGLVMLLLGFTGAPALATGGGNNGTIKIHEQGTPSGTESNDPKVCTFNVEGFGFDEGQTGYLYFDVQGGDGPTGTPAGPFDFGPTNADGYYATQYFNLDPGHYKATLYGKPGREDEKAKSKVFKVECEEEQSPEGNLVVSSDCESITIGMPTGVKPEGAQVVIKLDDVSVIPDTYPVTPGSHTVDLYVGGEKVDSKTVVVEECEESGDTVPVPSQATVDPCNPQGVANNVAWKDPLPADTDKIDWSESNDGATRTATLKDSDDKWSDDTKQPKVFNLPADSGVNCPLPPTDCTKFQDENSQEPCYVQKPPVTRVEIGTAEGCKLHGVGGVETTTTTITTTYSFNEQTQQWESSDKATSSVAFTPYTKAELKAKGCVKHPSPPPDNNPPSNNPPGLTGAPHTGSTGQGDGVPSRLPWFALGLGLMGAAYSIRRKAGVPA